MITPAIPLELRSSSSSTEAPRARPSASARSRRCGPSVLWSWSTSHPTGDGWLRMIGRDALHLALDGADAEIVGRVPVRTNLVQRRRRRRARPSGCRWRDRRGRAAAAGDHRRPWTVDRSRAGSRLDVPIAVVPTDWIERRRGVVTVGYDPTAVDETALFASDSRGPTAARRAPRVVAGPCRARRRSEARPTWRRRV